MRHSDRPISHPAEDVLGRSDFALALAHSIDQLKVAKDGFVIGLIGEWGSGKSSVVELTLRFLRHVEMARLSANARGEGKLTLERLDEMSDRFLRVEPIINKLKEDNRDVALWERHHRDGEFLRACGSQDDANVASEYWDLLQKTERTPGNLIVRFSPWLIAGSAELASALISDVARATGEKLGEEVREAFASLLSRLAQVAPLAGAAVDVATGGAFGGLISASLDVSDKLARRMTTGPTLDGVRMRLRRTLGALKDCKIIVVVDDLDRLTPAEAAEMVSLVKGLGDLPNVVYILCFDEIRLASLVTSALTLDGNEYLQKIVQYPVHLPPLETDDLARLLEADLGDMLPNLSNRNWQRISAAWLSFLQFYIRTPRDVRRLMNAFSVVSAGLADHTDPVDLLILEAIRIHEPRIYDWVRRNISSLTS
ncbi:hypothetical protein GR223_23675 [Rhizobium leguminosarum]|uniref:KAP family P-loop NTPase fold protein n=1 Tax=Rhizobium ruizarguesonis TaxID=2081791 RepID=UPI0013DF9B9C|nr:P-loop NTPase fold protein [Rhizobium ruizarguesonis]NEJ88895.1 hypothetical protein [Rhizobium ruizarguesonis]